MTTSVSGDESETVVTRTVTLVSKPRPNSFEISLRIMGTEVIGFKFSVGDFSSRWVALSVGLIVVLVLGLWLFGDDIASTFKAFKG